MNKSFTLEQLFTASTGDVDLQQKDINGKGTFFINSGVENRGIKGKTDRKAKIFPSGTITIDFFGNAYYRDFEYKMATHNHVFSLAGEVIKDDKVGLYLAVVLSKLSQQFSYNNMATWNKLKTMSILLPVIEHSDPFHEYTVDDIDWQYMHDHISELERDRISELDAYLQATGLNDYELTDEDRKVLSLELTSDEEDDMGNAGGDGGRFKEFFLGGENGVFDIYSPKKRFNANTVSFGGKYPYVARGTSNNGIRGYITEDTQYLSPANTLSFGQDTATVYYQPNAYFTGDKIKVMELKEKTLTPEIAEYFIAVIAKAFSTFSWGQNSFSENVIKSMIIHLPVTSDGEIDFDYMEHYIRAMEKVVIADVVKYKDRVLEETKKLVNRTSR